MNEIPRGNGEGVLLVDDDPATLYCIGDMLGRLGYAVIKSDSARAALDVLGAIADDVDIVITDHRMPGMSGLELVHALRANGRSCPAVLISGAGDLDAYLTANDTNGIWFLKKPVGVRDLAVAVCGALGRRPAGVGEQRQDRGAA